MKLLKHPICHCFDNHFLRETGHLSSLVLWYCLWYLYKPGASKRYLTTCAPSEDPATQLAPSEDPATQLAPSEDPATKLAPSEDPACAQRRSSLRTRAVLSGPLLITYRFFELCRVIIANSESLTRLSGCTGWLVYSLVAYVLRSFSLIHWLYTVCSHVD